MIVALAGLPGVGKTTLAEQLTSHIPGALLLRKDAVRHALFGTEHTTYTRDQDDHCVQALFATAVWQWLRAPATTVVLDGRTWLAPGQVEDLRAFAAAHRQSLLLLECVCPIDVAHARLAADHQHRLHPAANRTPQLHQELAATAVPITGPKLLLDTGKPVATNLDIILRHLDTVAPSEAVIRPPAPTTVETS
ncbi:AAA family ATPase [Amycolatopsis sp. H20-H5]|uniref:AAA family ATPase n=1 Tax=Amycolatopsis sp. H20-H5 TaxID=3046309 RepID=UPI002DC0262D|nr:AAA family ATPase [Amycolatopsis sp. H20-H5]MEC3978926.1 AAA family ATPase [Amycolatopsis sp. H20-H5]